MPSHHGSRVQRAVHRKCCGRYICMKMFKCLGTGDLTTQASCLAGLLQNSLSLAKPVAKQTATLWRWPTSQHSASAQPSLTDSFCRLRHCSDNPLSFWTCGNELLHTASIPRLQHLHHTCGSLSWSTSLNYCTSTRSMQAEHNHSSISHVG